MALTVQTLRALFEAALEHTGSTRDAFVADISVGDSALADRLRRLLAAHERAGDFIEKPAVDLSPDPPPELVGSTIEGFAVTRQIGRGGMGEVYLGELGAGRFPLRVAIKTVRWGVASEEVMRRFERERAILESLRHLAIARLRSAGQTPAGLPYFVMDYVDGVPIDEHCEIEKASINTRLHLFLAVCDAVQYAHEQGIVHRDIKPRNVLCAASGEPTLLDFGIAKLLNQDEAIDLTRTGHRVMTPEYASPEQVTGSAIGVTSDVYSLGVLLYELLTGMRPYFGAFRSYADAVQIVTMQPIIPPSQMIAKLGESIRGAPAPVRVSSGPRESASVLWRRLAGDLDAILLKALGKTPASRYESVAALMLDVKSHLSWRPIAARRRSVPYVAGRAMRRSLTLPTAMARRHASDEAVNAAIAELHGAIESSTVGGTESSFTTFLDKAQELVVRYPGHITLSRHIGFAANRIGIAQYQRRDLRSAARSFQRAFEAAEVILKRRPEDGQARRALTGNARNVGSVLDALGMEVPNSDTVQTEARRWYEEARRELDAMRTLGILAPTGEYLIAMLDGRLATLAGGHSAQAPARPPSK